VSEGTNFEATFPKPDAPAPKPVSRSVPVATEIVAICYPSSSPIPNCSVSLSKKLRGARTGHPLPRAWGLQPGPAEAGAAWSGVPGDFISGAHSSRL
jgi:hypothetical protein